MSGPRTHGQGAQGSNQHRRVPLNAFFTAQRERVEAVLEAYVRRVRARLWAYEEDLLEMAVKMGTTRSGESRP